MAEHPLKWQQWLTRWDEQQRGYLPHREERFEVMLDLLEATTKTREPLVVDIGCGPGSLASRVLKRLPGANVVAVDNDPVLMQLGQAAHSQSPRRIRWIDADLRSPLWTQAPGMPDQVDAVVSTTALHWLPSDRLAALYRQLAGLLRPGGIFINGDDMAFGSNQGRIAEAVHAVGAGRADLKGEVESWDDWWRAIELEPSLAAAFSQRNQRQDGQQTSHQPSSYASHREALLQAGFAEVATVWQVLEDRVLVAVR